MFRDICGSVCGTLAFACALFAPGYVTAHFTNVCEFRSRSLREQLAWSIVLSFGVGTIATVSAVWLSGVTGGAVVLVAFTLLAVIIAVRARPDIHNKWSTAVPYFLLGASLCVVVIGSLVDVGIDSRLYMSVTAYDNALRTAFVDTVLRTGVPPASPVYWPGHDAPMHYYYFWYVVCAVVAKLAHISARQALIASSAWSVFGVLAALALFGRHLLDWRGAELRRRWWTAVGLIAVTGFDGLIALVVYLHSQTVARDIEWWSLDQVTSWADTFLWVPHHAAALVCCVGSLLLIWISIRQISPKAMWAPTILAGVSFAGAFGLSTYIAVGMLTVTAALMIRECLSGNFRRCLRTSLAASSTAAIVLGPYIYQLLTPQQGARQSAGHVLAFGIRELLPPAVLLGAPGLRVLNETHPHAARELSAALLLAPSYILELGFFAFALLGLQRQREKTEGERALMFLTWTGLVAVSIVRSQVIAMNDYAIRASLLPQFFLLLVGVLALQRSRSLPRVFLTGALSIGAAGSVYQVLLLRFYLPIHEHEGVPAYADLSYRNYALRTAYADMQRRVAQGVRIQFNVPNSSYVGFAHLGNVGRQVIVEDTRCNDSFGGEITPCAGIQKTVAELFSGEQLLSAGRTKDLCGAIGAEYLVATSWDPVWKRQGSWPWTLPSVVTTPDVRVVACGKQRD